MEMDLKRVTGTICGLLVKSALLWETKKTQLILFLQDKVMRLFVVL